MIPKRRQIRRKEFAAMDRRRQIDKEDENDLQQRNAEAQASQEGQPGIYLPSAQRFARALNELQQPPLGPDELIYGRRLMGWPNLAGCPLSTSLPFMGGFSADAASRPQQPHWSTRPETNAGVPFGAFGAPSLSASAPSEILRNRSLLSELQDSIARNNRASLGMPSTLAHLQSNLVRLDALRRSQLGSQRDHIASLLLATTNAPSTSGAMLSSARQRTFAPSSAGTNPDSYQIPTSVNSTALGAPTQQAKKEKRSPVTLFTDDDENCLTAYQCLLRKQLEIFEAGPDDVKCLSQGRNTQIQVGQVGLRCRHCAGLPVAARTKGAVYYSQTIDGIYQIAQNISKVHLCERCYRIPTGINHNLVALRKSARRASGGKEYWAQGIRSMGVYQDGRILRMKNPD